MTIVPLAQGGEEGRDVGLGDLGERPAPSSGQVREVAAQVATVRRERVAGQPAFDGQVVEVGADRGKQLGGRLAQPRTSASDTQGSRCASATGA
jgi:hypothetical protein